MMDEFVTPALRPLVNQILDGCSIVMPPKCPAMVVPVVSIPQPEYSCLQCAEFAESVDLMAIAPLCVRGPSEECCNAVTPFKIEPCVNTMMDELLTPALVPLVNQILDGCSVVMPPKCPAAATVAVVKPAAATVAVVKAPLPEYSCSQCKDFEASINLMTLAPLCMGGASAECCASVAPFKLEPCVHSMMDAMPPAFAPLINQILDGCSIVMPARCPGAAIKTTLSIPVVPIVKVAEEAERSGNGGKGKGKNRVQLPVCSVADYFTAGDCGSQKRVGYAMLGRDAECTSVLGCREDRAKFKDGDIFRTSVECEEARSQCSM
jgi:hypothetical protein